MNNLPHVPVLLNEVLQYLAPIPGGRYLDATFGAGGYSRAICQQCACQVYGLDRDATVEHFANNLIKEVGARLQFIHGAFGDLQTIAKQQPLQDLDGVVFDIGISSMQVDNGERGFSFSKNGALDMRMDRTRTLTASDIVNTYSEKDLADTIYTLGGERKSRRIAATLVAARKQKPIETTLELADLVKQAVGRYHDDIHPATRTFQALRIEVNDELGELQKGLSAAIQLLKPGGRVVVVTFHSLEDKIVKDYFAKLAGRVPNQNRHAILDNTPSPIINFELLNRKVIVPSAQEIALNPRARSAKLRAIRRKI